MQWGLLNILHLMEFEKYYASIVESLNQPTRTCARRPHLLVCAPSNAATNNALKRVVQLGFFQTCGTKYTPAVVRIGASNLAQTDHSDEFCVEAKAKALMSMQHSEWLSWFSRQLHTVRSIEIEMKSQLSKLALLHERHENPDTVTANLLRMYENRDRAIADLSRLEYLRSYFDGSLRNQDELETLKMGLEASFADEAEIVFSTLASSGRSTLNRTKRTFTTVIIDEAAQCTELTTLFPLFTGVEHSVLIGDPKQLPSTVLSPIARQLQYGKSLFQRFVENHITVHSLGVQYRMHPDIRRFPSEFFYGGSLKDAENIKFECARLDFTLLSSHVQRVEFGPYLLFDTILGVEERNARGSLCNSYEARTCVTLLELLMASQARDARKLSVAILSPYIHQCELIQNLVDPLEIPGTITLLISTVDAFQGREADIVIFTCVRDASTTIGFLSDARRMNVALTRARSALWLLCNTQNAVKSELWRSLITDARERGLVIPAATLQHLV
jgi:senataxin